MAVPKTEIFVHAHWGSMPEPRKMGVLTAQEIRGALIWRFTYDPEWLKGAATVLLDPDLQWFAGPQYASEAKPNFGLFLDSMPDRWGRTLMRKRESMLRPASDPAGTRVVLGRCTTESFGTGCGWIAVDRQVPIPAGSGR